MPKILASQGNHRPVDQEAKEGADIDGIDFKPVANFYAVGELVGGANGKDSMPSMMNSWSYASGFVAGRAAADNANNYAVDVVTSASHAPAPKPEATSGASH